MAKKKIPKLSEKKAKALQLIKKRPNAALIEIGREMVKLGVMEKAETIYNLTRNDRDMGYIHGEITEIKRKNLEMMSREIVPEALKIHRQVLKDKKIPNKKKKDWVQMAEKAEFQFDETKRPTTPQTVNILAIQKMIFNEMTAKQEGIIDVTPFKSIEEKGEDV